MLYSDQYGRKLHKFHNFALAPMTVKRLTSLYIQARVRAEKAGAIPPYCSNQAIEVVIIAIGKKLMSAEWYHHVSR